MSISLSAVIIDDESSSRSALRAKLGDHCPEVTIVGECGDGEEGIKVIGAVKPELVFLDIEMPWLNGFAMLQRIERRDFEVIFVTAYDHYAIKAIKFSALDYLVKPVEVEGLREAVAKASAAVAAKRQQAVGNERLDLLLANLRIDREVRQRIAIPSMEGLQFIRIEDIVYLEAVSNYTVLFLASGKMTVSKTLKEFEELLPVSIFVRIHHSYIVNCDAVEKYIRGEGGQVVMKNGAVLDVSKRKKGEFLKAMQI